MFWYNDAKKYVLITNIYFVVKNDFFLGNTKAIQQTPDQSQQ